MLVICRLLACCLSLLTVVVSILLTAQIGSAATTIAHIRVVRAAQNTVIGTPPQPVHLLAMDFVDPRHGFLATQTAACPEKRCSAALLTTINGGQIWQTTHLGISFHNLSFLSDRLGFGVDEAGGLLGTHDGGHHWSVSPAPAHKASGVAFVDVRHGWLLAGRLYRTVDSGRRWTPLPFRCGRLQMIARLSFVDRRTGFLLCQVENGPFAVTLYRSTDSGASWHKVSTVDPMAHVLGAFEFISPRIGFVSAGFGDLRRTTDGGHTFRQVPGTPFEGVQTVSWFRPHIGYFAANLAVMKTIDGTHWRHIYPTVKPRDRFRSHRQDPDWRRDRMASGN
jgi:photosystem II stability/assembly factor-like uncharacterized protein